MSKNIEKRIRLQVCDEKIEIIIFIPFERHSKLLKNRFFNNYFLDFGAVYSIRKIIFLMSDFIELIFILNIAIKIICM